MIAAIRSRTARSLIGGAIWTGSEVRSLASVLFSPVHSVSGCLAAGGRWLLRRAMADDPLP